MKNRFTDKSVYTDLAWDGIDFENNDSLNDNDRNRIQITITQAQLSGLEKTEIITAFQ